MLFNESTFIVLDKLGEERSGSPGARNVVSFLVQINCVVHREKII